MIMPMVFTPADPLDFSAVISQTDLGAASLTELAFSSHRVARGPALIRHGDPEMYIVVFHVRGTFAMSHTGREITLGAGDMALGDSSLPYHSVVGNGPGMTESLLLHLPKRLVPLPAAALERLLATRLPYHRGIGSVVAHTLTRISAEAHHCTPADSARLGTAAVELTTALLTHHLHAADPLPATSRPSALLLRIEAFIQENLADPELTPASLAAAQHISIRYLHHLFKSRETTAAAYIRTQRLNRCRSDLANPDLTRIPIRAIATRWGFNDPATFSRTFHSAYGMPPREYRHQQATPSSSPR
jgi:AraC-like DNA-binding protein